MLRIRVRIQNLCVLPLGGATVDFSVSGNAWSMDTWSILGVSIVNRITKKKLLRIILNAQKARMVKKKNIFKRNVYVNK